MKIAISIIGISVFALLIFVVYRYIKVHSQNEKLNRESLNRVKFVYDKLINKETLTKEEVFPFAENILAREMVYKILKEYNRTDLFPEEYYTIVKAAESNLANWLKFPTELGVCPDEMEYIKRVTFDFDGQNHFVHFEVFKYRVNEPHWAANAGWMLGVVGPYFDDSKPYDFPSLTFSRINSISGETTPDGEAGWVYENLFKRQSASGQDDKAY
jgi:hypothetical protein